jgi:nucleotide-binding universal stress UspA family protein
MVQFTHILCPTDLSDLALAPVTHAAALARRFAAHLTLLHVVPTFDPVSVRPVTLDGTVQFIQPASREEVQARLAEVLEAVGAASTDAACTADAGDPSKRIVDQAVAIPADLIVLGTHGRGGFERFVLGSVAEKVLQKAPCPVLTVPPHATPRPAGELRFRHILCPVDFSASALQAFGFAVELARQFGASLTLLHVIEWLAEEEPRAHAHFNVPEYRQHLMRDAHDRVRTLIADERGASGPIADVVRVGRPYREILRLAAESPADLIVMGTQGQGGVGHALFGSTTHQVVRAAHCPVLTVRMAGRPRPS